MLSGVMQKQEPASAFSPQSRGTPGGGTRVLSVGPGGVIEAPSPGGVSSDVPLGGDVAGPNGFGSVEMEMVRPAGTVDSFATGPAPVVVAPRPGPVSPTQVTTPNGVQTITFETMDEVQLAMQRAVGVGSSSGRTPVSTIALGPVTLAEAGGPVQAAGQAPQAVPAGGKTYTVKANDTLYGIARLHYGPTHGAQYTRIVDANQSTISNSNVLKVGMVLVIPPLDATAAAAPTTPAATPPAKSSPPTVPAREWTDTAIVQGPTPDAASSRMPALNANESKPATKTHTVQKGDTLTKIAMANNTKVPDLVKLNNIANPDNLRIGQVLVVK